MLAVLACWIALLIVAGSLGRVILASVDQDFFEARIDRLVVGFWLGFLAFGSVLLLLATITPLTAWVGLAVALTLVAICRSFGAGRTVFSELAGKKWAVVAVCVLVLAVARDAIGPVTAYDTGLYHYQLVEWLGSAGVAPGLALFDGRLGFVSSWFALSSVFNHGPLEARVSSIMGELVALLVLVHLASLLTRFRRGSLTPSSVFLLASFGIILPASYWWSFQASLSVDWPVWIVGVLVAWSMFRCMEVKRHFWLPACLGGLALALKLSALPIAIVSLLFLIANGWRGLSWSRAAAIGVLSLAPIPMANVIASGCVVFPASWSCISPVESDRAARMSVLIDDWHSRAGAYATKPDAHWLLEWLRVPDHALMTLLILSSGFVLLAFRFHRTQRAGVWTFSLAMVGTLFVMLTAPSVRFGLSYFAMFPALAAAVLCSSYRSAFHRPNLFRGLAQPVCALLLATGVLVNTVAREYIFEAAAGAINRASDAPGFGLVVPPALPRTEGEVFLKRNRRELAAYRLRLETVAANEVSYYRPIGSDQCWAAPLPCTSTDPPAQLRLRDPSRGLSGGFEIREQPGG